MKPILQALLLADHVYEDKTTGKKIVAGVFQHFYFKDAKEFQEELKSRKIEGVPGGLQASSPFAYINLTDVRGQQPFVLRYVDLESDKAVFEAKFDVSCNNPLESVEVIAALPPLPHKQGVFALELTWKDEPLGAYRVVVGELQMKVPDDDTSRSD